MADLVKIRDLAFGAFGLALGYAGKLGVPQQNLLVLALGLLGCAVAYFCIGKKDPGFQALILSVGAIAILTSKLFSAVFTLVFLFIGFLLMVATLVVDLREFRSRRKLLSGQLNESR
jgi:hypothetical protein